MGKSFIIKRCNKNSEMLQDFIPDKKYIQKIIYETDLMTLTQINVPEKLIINSPNDRIMTITRDNVIFHNDIDAVNGNFSGELNAADVNILGDVVASNIYVSNKLLIENMLTSQYANIINDINVGGILTAPNGIHTDLLNVDGAINTNSVNTNNITSLIDLNLIPAPNCSVNVANIRNNVSLVDGALIGGPEIKAFKYFVITKNVMLESDTSIDGMEIIIINNNIGGDVIVRDRVRTIKILCPLTSIRLVYIFGIDRWISI
jgi:hypothetical protein